MRSAPEEAHQVAAALLSPLDEHLRQTFALRLDRYWEDLHSGLGRLYGERADAVALELVGVAAQTFVDRPSELRDLDERRLLTPDWLQQPDMVGYACYTERFADDLSGVVDRIGYLEELGVTYLHLMPLLTPRPGDSDGGYAVADFRSVRSDLGTTADLAELAQRLRERGISLVLDLVLNHVAREHEWAQRCRAGEERYRRYFHVFADRTEPDAYEQTLPDVFPAFAPGNFTWDEQAQGWVWTTFNEWQWDVNWANPDVLVEYAGIIGFLANLGVEVLRLDAIAFTWKRKGTNSQNQPEVHALTQALHAVSNISTPALRYKAEAIVGPRDLVPYLGTGSHVGRISDLAYHNTMMVQVWNMLATQSTTATRHVLRNLPATPPQGTWVSYLRCHDDVGWAIDDRDASDLGFDGLLHRQYLARWYAGEFDGSWADGLVFQHNPETGDMRTSGTAASMAGLRTLPSGDQEGGLARLFVANAITYGFGGLPIVWSGDELGLPNDPVWSSEVGHESDNRWAHRPRIDWTRAAARTDLSSTEGKVFQSLVHLGRVRAGLPQMHSGAHPRVLDDLDDGLLGLLRTHPSGIHVGLYNVTPTWRAVDARVLGAVGLVHPFENLGAQPLVWGADGVVQVPPYAAWWLTESAP